MASMDVTGLLPGQNYKVQLFAVRTEPDGTVTHSNYSVPITIATSGSSASGNNLLAPNNGTDIRLSGGSIFAGDFPVNAGTIDVGGSEEIDATGVVLNRSGLAGFASGVKEFWIEAATGKAYFAGTVTAGTVTIGSDINGTGKTGIYIDDKNYWYSDGKFSATSTDVAGALTNKDPQNPLVPPSAVSNLTAAWVSGKMHIAWTFDEDAPENKFARDIILKITASGTTKIIPLKVSENYYDLTMTQIQALFNFKVTSFTNVSVYTGDAFGNYSAEVSVVPGQYTNTLPAPSIIVSTIKNGYSVKFNKPSDISYSLIAIEEIVSDAASAPLTNYTQVYVGTLDPNANNEIIINILCSDISSRWVRATFQDTSGTYGPISTAYPITPSSPVTITVTAPTDPSTLPTAAWSGDDIVLTYSLPSTNAGTKIFVTLTSPDGLKGYFYLTPEATSNQQSSTIIARDIYAQFGQYFDHYTGLFQSQSNTGVLSPGLSITVPVKSNELINIVPSPTISSVINGYSAAFNFAQYPTAVLGEIYEKFTPWTTATLNSNIPDSFTSSYSSGGAPGQKTLVLNNFKNQDDVSIVPTLYDGYKITGNGIPDNTWITGITGSGPYTITLNNNLLSQASGSYNAYSLVYSGGSPGFVYSDFYQERYIIVKYYDNYGNYSKPSIPVAKTPTNPVTALIDSAVKVGGTSGAIYVGDTSSPSSGARVLLGANSTLAGIFAFDSKATNPSTSIIAQADQGGYTFSTTSARIASWTITSDKIQNELYVNGNGNNYTGMSASAINGYSFWAGSSVSGGAASANFSVTDTGFVTARKISIIGDGTTSELINASGLFKVFNDGKIEATSAKISGEITATKGTFSGDIIIGTTGSIYSKNVVPATSNGQGFILNQNGLRFNSSTVNGITTIDGSTGLLSTSSANIGGWLVDGTTINKTAGTGGNTKAIILDSANARIKVSSATTGAATYTAGMALPSAAGDIVFWAGSAGEASPSNGFYVTADGVLHATGAIFSGYAKSTDIPSLSGYAKLTDIPSVSSFITSSQVNGFVTAIDGSTITTGTIALNRLGIFSSTPTATSAYFTLDSSGIRAYSWNGTTQVKTVEISSNGAASFSGSITSGSTITGAVITNGTNFSVDASGVIKAVSGQIGGFDLSNGDLAAKLNVGPRIIFGSKISMGWESGYPFNSSNVFNFVAGNSITDVGQQFYVNTSTNVFRFAADSSQRSYAAEIRNDIRARQYRYIAGGGLVNDTSSRRFKENITYAPKSYYDRILQINPAFYTYIENHPETSPEVWGVHAFGPIAEDLEDAGLGLFVERNLNGQPTSILNEHKLTLLLIPIIRDLKQKIEDVEQKILELESK